ncbi:MAG: hypothetical protein K0U84_13525 [Actinomycetia bacterium]|nr:hypothetical protein [Actinomycetes bacterium]
MNGMADKDGVVRIPQKYFAAWAMISILGGGGLATGVQLVAPETRAEAFTSTRGDILEARVENLERIIVALATSGPTEVRKGMDRLERGQSEIKLLIRQHEEWKGNR